MSGPDRSLTPGDVYMVPRVAINDEMVAPLDIVRDWLPLGAYEHAMLVNDYAFAVDLDTPGVTPTGEHIDLEAVSPAPTPRSH